MSEFGGISMFSHASKCEWNSLLQLVCVPVLHFLIQYNFLSHASLPALFSLVHFLQPNAFFPQFFPVSLPQTLVSHCKPFYSLSVWAVWGCWCS